MWKNVQHVLVTHSLLSLSPLSPLSPLQPLSPLSPHLASEEAVPKCVQHCRQPKEETQNDIHYHMDIAIAAMDENCQWLKN
uniref:Bm11619 n=1 Tax=Brugia malayi TaxID=6279 RepID=A0A1I9G7U5_BRUMA|nr:Bm11619 [Brugia malayi]